MSISSVNSFIGANTQILTFWKTELATNNTASGSAGFQSAALFSGNPPGIGSISNTTVGRVPTNTSNGFPTIILNDTEIRLCTVEYGCVMLPTGSNNGPCRYMLYDRLFHAGAYSFNSNVTLGSQPSYVSRVPNGDYRGTEIWCEVVTNITGTLSVTVTYTDQDGNVGATTGAVSIGISGVPVGQAFKLPFAAGDTGVQKIESVVGSSASAGTFNIFVARPLWGNWHNVTAVMNMDGPMSTGMPLVYANSALNVIVWQDAQGSGGKQMLPEMLIVLRSS